MSAVPLLLLLAAAVACAEGIRIAGRDYRYQQLQGGGGAKSRIVSTGNAVMYTALRDRAYVLREGVTTSMEGLPDTPVYDLLLDFPDVVWVATHIGLYQYSISEKKATKFSGRRMYRLGAAANGTVYASDYNTAALYMRSGESLHLVSERRIRHFAFTREGHCFYVGYRSSTLYKATGGPAGALTRFADFEGDTMLLELDRRDDVLYICSEGGLYTVLPGRDAAEQVDGVEWSVNGLGFSPKGDIYLGRETEITTMSLIFPITLNKDTFYTKLDRKLETMNEEIADQVEKKISMHIKLSEEIDKKLSDFISQMSSAVDGLQKTVQTLRGECSVRKEKTEAKLDILDLALLLPDNRPASTPGQPS